MENEIRRYQSLNKLAKTDGCVIFGCAEDQIIPLGELIQSFALQGFFYNRSFSGLCVSNAAALFDLCVAPLAPKEIYLHIGQNDLETFPEDPAVFDQAFTRLLQHICSGNKKCRIAIIGLKNPHNDPVICRMNKHLAVISRNERCEFCDIANPKVWNPQQTKEIISFLSSVGIAHSAKTMCPVQDIAKILFCC